MSATVQYLPVRVQYLPYKGQKYPVRISYYAIKKFQQETGKSIEELDSDISLLESLLWYGLVAGAQAENSELTIKREDMEFVLDESLVEFNEMLMSFFPLPSDQTSNSKKK